MSPLVVYWLLAALICGAAGAAVHHSDRFSGLILGAAFGPFGIIVAAIANANVTLEEIRDKMARDPRAAPVGVATMPGNPNRIVCHKCGGDYPRGLSKCVTCGAKSPA